MSRPHYTNKDENHYIIRDFMKVFCGGYEERKDGKTFAYSANYRGHKMIAYDTANYGGVFGDWLLECVTLSRFTWVEVKTEGTLNKEGEFKAGTFKDGEEWLRENSSSWYVIVTEQNVKDLFDIMVMSELNWMTGVTHF